MDNNHQRSAPHLAVMHRREVRLVRRAIRYPLYISYSFSGQLIARRRHGNGETRRFDATSVHRIGLMHIAHPCLAGRWHQSMSLK